MNSLIIWTLAGAFINVTVLTRVAQYLLRKTSLRDKKRAIVVFIIVGIIDLLGLTLFFKSVSVGIQFMIFYYLPFLLMWLLKDFMEASRKKAPRDARPQ